MMVGTVAEFDEVKGLGLVRSADGTQYLFHLVEIADGTRTIDVGQKVRFEPLPRFGSFQAGNLHKV
jgi:cold shock CspA family protein